MASSLVLPFTLIVVLLPSSPAVAEIDAVVKREEAVLTQDAGNFSEVVAKHQFIVVEFYAPWCGHCKQLAPEYEKAASVLRKNDPPVVLAKVDAYNEMNKELKDRCQVHGYPTIKIIKNGGSDVRDYGGLRDANRIVEYLKRRVGPASIEIGRWRRLPAPSATRGWSLWECSPSLLVGSMKLSWPWQKRCERTMSILSCGNQAVKGPLVRLFKPFDELFVNSQAMLFLSFSDKRVETFKS